MSYLRQAGSQLARIADSPLVASFRDRYYAYRVRRIKNQLEANPHDVANLQHLGCYYALQFKEKKAGGASATDLMELKEMTRDYYARALQGISTRLDPVDGAKILHMTTTNLLMVKEPEFNSIAVEYMLALARSPVAMVEFCTKSEFQERGSSYNYAAALTMLKMEDNWEKAAEVLEEATSVEIGGMRPIGWQHVWQTPTVYIPEIGPSTPWWDVELLPIAKVLRENYDVIKKDFDALVKTDAPSAYPNLISAGGTWEMITLFTRKSWDPKVCEALPNIARLLQDALPGNKAGLPNIVYNSEEVSIFRVTPGTTVLRHNGGVNARVNVTIGLRGCQGCFLEVRNERREWADGEVMAFDDSVDHAVIHEGPEDRWVLTVGIMHPQLVAQPWLFGRCHTGCTEYQELADGELERYRQMAPPGTKFDFSKAHAKGIMECEQRLRDLRAHRIRD